MLAAIIEAYVSSASPVGSELISRQLRPSLSSATIRNVMAELEGEGLLEQPHTSAGRVPTDLGYRRYVDSLMKSAQLNTDEVGRLSQLIRMHETGMEHYFNRVGETLSTVTQLAAFVMAPTVKHSTIKQIQLTPVSARRLLCVVIGQDGTIASHIIELVEVITRDEAASLVHFLNTELTGVSAQELLQLLERRLLAVSDSFYHLVKRSLTILQLAFATEPDEHFLLEGAAQLFGQPEFQRDPQKAHQLLRALDLRAELLQRVRLDLAQAYEQLQVGRSAHESLVRIGRELNVVGLEGCSYILAPFVVQGHVVGGVGVLGPKRMDYARLQALVENMATQSGQTLAAWQQDA